MSFLFSEMYGGCLRGVRWATPNPMPLSSPVWICGPVLCKRSPQIEEGEKALGSIV